MMDHDKKFAEIYSNPSVRRVAPCDAPSGYGSGILEGKRLQERDTLLLYHPKNRSLEDSTWMLPDPGTIGYR